MPAGRVGAPPEGACSADVGPEERQSPGAARPLVPCELPHGSETWRVVELPAPWTDASAARPSAGSAEEQVLGRLAAERCPESDWRQYANLPGAVATDRGERTFPTPLRPLWFYPSAEQWSQGARWIRCDLGLSWDGASRSAVPWRGALAGAQDSRSRLMLATDCRSGADGPDKVRNRSCDQAHDAEAVSVYRVGPGERPPARAGPPDDWASTCTADTGAHLGSPSAGEGTPSYRLEVSVQPSGAAAWSAGDRTMTCWFSFRSRGDGRRIMTAEPAIGTGARAPVPVSAGSS